MGVAGQGGASGLWRADISDDTFWGLEFPGGVNAYADGMLSLTQHPGRAVAEPWTSKTAVVGVAEPTRVQSRFLTYVKTFQATPKDLKLFVNYNTWWTLMPPDERNCLALIELFRKKLFLPYGASIDTFTIDCGWNNPESLWAISKDRFPTALRGEGAAPVDPCEPWVVVVAVVVVRAGRLVRRPRLCGQQQRRLALPIGAQVSSRSQGRACQPGQAERHCVLEIRRLYAHLREDGTRPLARQLRQRGEHRRLHRAHHGRATGAARPAFST